MPHGVCGAIGACAVLHTRHRLSIVSAADIANLHCVHSAVQVFQCLRFPMQNFKFNKTDIQQKTTAGQADGRIAVLILNLLSFKLKRPRCGIISYRYPLPSRGYLQSCPTANR